MSSYRVPAVDSAVRLLSLLVSPEGQPSSQTELARAAGLSKSTAHNLLATLESARFVQRDPGSRRYRLGPALIPLGAAAARQTRVVAIAVERVAQLPASLGVSVALAQPTPEHEAQVIESFYPDDMHVGITIGSRFNCFDGALGKCLMAAMPEADLKELLEGHEIPKRTPATITSKRRLLQEVRLVGKQGWASSIREYNENNAVAAPVLGVRGDPELIILAVGFVSQLPDDTLPEVGRRLQGIAERIRSEATGLGLDGGLAGD